MVHFFKFFLQLAYIIKFTFNFILFFFEFTLSIVVGEKPVSSYSSLASTISIWICTMRWAKRALCHASGKFTHRKPESFPPFRPSMTSFYCFRHFFVNQDFFLHFRWQRVPLTPHFHFLHMFNIEMTNPLTLDIFTVLKVCWMTALAAVIVSIKPQDIVSFAKEG